MFFYDSSRGNEGLIQNGLLD